MSRVLIWKRVFAGSEYDIFHPTDYENLYEHIQKDWKGQGQNWGNKLWFQGIYSAIDTGENEYGFIGRTIDVEQINSDYDFIVLPMANIFYKGFLALMRELTVHLERIRIPVYVVACGVQADSYDDLPELISDIGEDSARFIRAVYNTGGEFALRGYFTEAFFKRLGFNSAVVTGCPSMYQMGPDFCVNNKSCAFAELHPVFNGKVKALAQLLDALPNSVFMDQDQYLAPLLQPDYLQDSNLRIQMHFVDCYGEAAAKLLSEGRIIMAADMNDWSNYLRKGKFNYSFGSRIHGTIMALLSGIPATITVHDSRTREMAEFFDIPRVAAHPKHSFSVKEFYAIHEKVDYSGFNRTFRGKFNAYEQFLHKCGIVSHVNTENRFFYDAEARVFAGTNEKREQFAWFANTLDKNSKTIGLANFAKRIVGRIR